ncbi:hypothetical protein HMI55_006060 [Coelomomyces lativittatus]|nr:hypothetical protein HMI55_006060 [Coelomomyces lativittatus]
MHNHRRVGVNDIPEITRLLKQSYYYADNPNAQTLADRTDSKLGNSESLFGWTHTDASKIIERSTMCLVQDYDEFTVSESKSPSPAVSSVFSLSVAPILPFISEKHPLTKFYREIQKFGWVEFFRKTFFDGDLSPNEEINSTDTLYLSFYCYDKVINESPNGSMTTLKAFLQTSFALAENISAICFVLPVQSPIPDFLIGPVPIFSKWSSKNKSFPFHLVVFHRKIIFPPLKIRRAHVEDCDDLVPLFKQHNMLPVEAGDYHVAEILESKDPSCISLVGEINGQAVAFLSVSTKVAMESLLSSFALDTYSDILDKTSDTFENNLSSIASLHVSLQNLISIPEPDKTDSPNTDIQNMASTVHTAATNDVFTLASELKAKSHENPPPPELSDNFNSFCIKFFCIDDVHIHHSFEFLKVILFLFDQ